MALETDLTNILANQHLRVLRSVGFVAALAAFFADRRMLESERTAFVAMALVAAGFIGAHHLHHPGFETAVGIMAIHTAHGAFRDTMFKWLGE
jgi:hypothetical protein